jgi:hypothetical protein
MGALQSMPASGGEPERRGLEAAMLSIKANGAAAGVADAERRDTAAGETALDLAGTKGVEATQSGRCSYARPYNDIHARSLADPSGFWGEAARE